MAGSVNKVIIVGHLGRDPESRSFQNGGKVVGRYGFVLRNPRPIELIPCKGALGFFNVPAHVAQMVEAHLS